MTRALQCCCVTRACVSLHAGCPVGAVRGRGGTSGRARRSQAGGRRSSGFPAPGWTGDPAAYVRAAPGAVLQSPAPAPLLRPHEGRLPAGRGVLLRHLVLLRRAAEEPGRSLKTRRIFFFPDIRSSGGTGEGTRSPRSADQLEVSDDAAARL